MAVATCIVAPPTLAVALSDVQADSITVAQYVEHNDNSATYNEYMPHQSGINPQPFIDVTTGVKAISEGNSSDGPLIAIVTGVCTIVGAIARFFERRKLKRELLQGKQPPFPNQ